MNAQNVTQANAAATLVNVRYMIDDVDAAVAFYTKHLGFTLAVDSRPAFAAVTRGHLRLLLSGEEKFRPAALARRHEAGAGRLEPASTHCHGHRGGGSTTSGRRGEVPSR
jgi:catechol 2,3-dioxygenase-like lactoylglutathione lyase family enzyme